MVCLHYGLSRRWTKFAQTSSDLRIQSAILTPLAILTTSTSSRQPGLKQSILKMYILVAFCVLFINLPTVTTFVDEELGITLDQVKTWASKFGNEINVGSSRATCYEVINNVSDSFN